MEYSLLIVFLFFVFFVPFIPLGGGYFRSLLLIFVKDHVDSGGGFINFFPDIPYLRRVRGANPISFRYLSGEYARDHRYVYVFGYRIEGSEPKAFRQIATPFPITISFSNEQRPDFYYVDGKGVRSGSVLTLKVRSDEAEPENFHLESFEPLGGGFLLDETGVYYTSSGGSGLSERLLHSKYEWSIFLARNLEIVDASTFHLTELTSMKCSAIDKNFEYNVRQFTYGCMHKQAVDGVLEITNFHGQCEFNDLGSRYYSVDGKVYFSEKRLYEADADTFEVISVQYNRHTYRYAKDSRSVYFMARKLKNADPKTFQIIPTSPYYSFDRERRYSQGNNIADFGPSFARSENEKFEEAFVKWKSGAETNLTSETCTSSRKRRSGLSGRRANGLEDSSRLG